jgi:hypothetical protein
LFDDHGGLVVLSAYRRRDPYLVEVTVDGWVVSDIAVEHITMLSDVGAQSLACNRETLHFFDVTAAQFLRHVYVEIAPIKPDDDEIRLVLELHDARVAAEVLIGLHTRRESKTSAVWAAVPR